MLNHICVAFSLALDRTPVSGGENATQDDADCSANAPEPTAGVIAAPLSDVSNKLFRAKVNLHTLRRTTRHTQHDAKVDLMFHLSVTLDV